MSPVLRAAFQGELGAFSEEAMCRFFGELGEEVTPVPCREFVDVGRAVMEGEAEYGVLPIENTLAGSVIPTYNVLASHDLATVGEVVIPVHHCVLGIPGARVEELARVLSHPVALAQCTRFLQSLAGAEAVAVYDTAGAAREVADRGSRALGAIAGRRNGTGSKSSPPTSKTGATTRPAFWSSRAGTRPTLPFRRSGGVRCERFSWCRRGIPPGRWCGCFSPSRIGGSTCPSWNPARRESRGATTSSWRWTRIPPPR